MQSERSSLKGENLIIFCKVKKAQKAEIDIFNKSCQVQAKKIPQTLKFMMI